jgi:hypothetical protein
LGRVDERVGERAGVSRDTVRKVQKILEYESITADKINEDLRSGKVSINEAYEIVELDQLDQEHQSFYQKCLKAFEEMKRSYAEIDNRPE